MNADLKQIAKKAKIRLSRFYKKPHGLFCGSPKQAEKRYVESVSIPGCIFADPSKAVPYFQIPLKDCVGHIYIGFGATGWNPFTESVKHYLAKGNWDVLQRWYDIFQPKSLAELYFCDNDASYKPLNEITPFCRLKPWRETTMLISGNRGGGNQNFGPVSEEKFVFECNRYKSIINSFAVRGYDIKIGGPIKGYFLIDNKGAFVFRVTAGMHRIIVADAMGWETIPASFDLSMPRYVHESTISYWPHVQSGKISIKLANYMLNQHFLDKGFDKKKRFEATLMQNINRSTSWSMSICLI